MVRIALHKTYAEWYGYNNEDEFDLVKFSIDSDGDVLIEDPEESQTFVGIYDLVEIVETLRIAYENGKSDKKQI